MPVLNFWIAPCIDIFCYFYTFLLCLYMCFVRQQLTYISNVFIHVFLTFNISCFCQNAVYSTTGIRLVLQHVYQTICASLVNNMNKGCRLRIGEMFCFFLLCLWEKAVQNQCSIINLEKELVFFQMTHIFGRISELSLQELPV